jgi:hypothetical protein
VAKVRFGQLGVTLCRSIALLAVFMTTTFVWANGPQFLGLWGILLIAMGVAAKRSWSDWFVPPLLIFAGLTSIAWFLVVTVLLALAFGGAPWD